MSLTSRTARRQNIVALVSKRQEADLGLDLKEVWPWPCLRKPMVLAFITVTRETSPDTAATARVLSILATSTPVEHVFNWSQSGLTMCPNRAMLGKNYLTSLFHL